MKFITLTTVSSKGDKSRRVNFDFVRCYKPTAGSTPGTTIFFAGDVKGAYPYFVEETVEQIDALIEAIDSSNTSTPSIVLSLAGDEGVEEDDDT